MLVPTPHTIRARKGKPLPRMVEHDVYHVTERIRELDSRLFVMLFEDTPKPWVVYEQTPSGPQVVQRYEELTPLILEDLQRMMAIPFSDRVAQISAEIDAHNDALGKMDPERIERLAFNMRKAMVQANMIDTPDFSSFPVTRGRVS